MLLWSLKKCTNSVANRARTVRITASISVLQLLLLLAQAAMAAESRNVLVLHSNNRLVPGNIAVDRGSARRDDELAGSAGADLLRVPRPARLRRRRVRTHHDDVPAGEVRDATTECDCRGVGQCTRLPAAQSRTSCFPGVPLVHVGVSKSHLQIDSEAACRRDRRSDRVRFLRHHRAGAALASRGPALADRDRRSPNETAGGKRGCVAKSLPVAGNVPVEFLAGLADRRRC